MAKKQLNKTEDSIHFTEAIKAGTKNKNVKREIDKLCDQLITDAITDTVLQLNTKPEKLEFKNEFLNWSKIESCLDKTATENIKEINTDKVKVKEHLAKFKTKPDFKELEKIEEIAEHLTKNKLNRFLNEDRLNVFIKERNSKLKELEETKNTKIQKRKMAIGIDLQTESVITANNAYKKKIWFRVGLMFANGEMQELLKQPKANPTNVAKKLNNMGYNKYILATHNNYSKNNLDKNIYADPYKLQMIYDHCKENNIDIVDDFLKHIKSGL